MQGCYEARFEREMGCTAEELCTWLPGASRHARIEFDAQAADIHLASGRARLQWQTLPPRRIALVTLPRLAVRFDFTAVSQADREAYMRHFDLYTQRGGG